METKPVQIEDEWKNGNLCHLKFIFQSNFDVEMVESICNLSSNAGKSQHCFVFLIGSYSDVRISGRFYYMIVELLTN